ncbi:SDR family oxidoreductase [Streptomyces sp. NPDC005811]|uniref:SDR family oxidoreductase n=1 Tax=Streptomyces sp. NPDC005811 TaxID=3154565 RepID=UPI003404AED3
MTESSSGILFDLSGKTAVVTGGSCGMGLMAARGLLAAGARVYAVSRDAAACERAAEDLAQYGDVVPLGRDLSTAEGCAAVADEITALENALHVLVNNAGAAWGAPLDEYPVSGWDKVINLNLRSPFLLIQALLPALEAGATADDLARVVNVGSIDGLRVPRMPTYAYSASKAGLHHLTRVLAVDLGTRHITVNAVAPGPFESKMMSATLDEIKDDLERAAPLGRIGRPDDIAGVMVFLASRAAWYVTGAVVPVEGGIRLVNVV